MRKPVFAYGTAHPCSLISAFVVHCLACNIYIYILAKSKISILQLVSVAQQAGLSFSWSQTPKKVFLMTSLIFHRCWCLKMPLMAWRQPTLPGCRASGSRIKNRTDLCCMRKRNWFLTLSRTLNQKWATSWQNQQSGMCAQRRLRSAWASAQSDQSLRCPHEESSGS